MNSKPVVTLSPGIRLARCYQFFLLVEYPGTFEIQVFCLILPVTPPRTINLMEQDILSTTIQNKVYSERSIALAILVGGPFLVGYFVAHNFRQLNQPEKVKKTWLFSTIGLFIFFVLAGIIPESVPVPNLAYNFAIAMIALLCIQKYQGKYLKQHIADGGPVYSTWKAVGLTLAFLAALFAIILLLLFLLEPSALEL
ncbi:MAG TPA: hypothetical protein VEY06_05330 [Flavisolibacter sp.]|nr:hypothetical protein [Flavisolibacter sp.]